MVKDYEQLNKLNKLFNRFKDEELAGKKRFDLKELEDYLVEKAGGVTAYEEAGGYSGLYRLIKEKEKQRTITAIKSSNYNGRTPGLKRRWQLVEDVEPGWEDETVFKLSRRLNLSYYLKRPRLQTEELLQQLKTIDQFLAGKKNREWASREERSLELFGDEKYLSEPEGKALLNHLHLSLVDLKAEKYSQMFVYWNKGISAIKNVLILENHSSFISCKRAVEDGFSICSYQPDTLIYGQGKHIVDSLKFIEELIEVDKFQIKYAGDIDPSGLAIYTALKRKYPDYDISLHLNYYRQMLNRVKNDGPLKNRPGTGYLVKSKQDKNESVLEGIKEELLAEERRSLYKMIETLWENNLRIPQEVITFEMLKNE